MHRTTTPISLFEIFRLSQYKVAFMITLLCSLTFLTCSVYILNSLIEKQVITNIRNNIQSIDKNTRLDNNEKFKQQLSSFMEKNYLNSLTIYNLDHQVISELTSNTHVQNPELYFNFLFFSQPVLFSYQTTSSQGTVEVSIRTKPYLFYYFLIITTALINFLLIPLILFVYLYRTRRFLKKNIEPLVFSIHQFTDTNEWPKTKINQIEEFQMFNRTFDTLLEKYISTKQNLSDQNTQLEFQAHHDVLTRLPNRQYFQKTINQYFNRNMNQFLALFYIDNNKFKFINDTYGHQTGDAVLVETAKRLKDNLPSDAFIARLGGDEFAVVLKKVNRTIDLEQICEKLIESCYEPLIINDNRIPFSFSVGASYAYDAKNLDDLLHQADEAMYRAKKSDRKWAVFNPTYFEDHLFLDHD